MRPDSQPNRPTPTCTRICRNTSTSAWRCPTCAVQHAVSHRGGEGADSSSRAETCERVPLIGRTRCRKRIHATEWRGTLVTVRELANPEDDGESQENDSQSVARIAAGPDKFRERHLCRDYRREIRLVLSPNHQRQVMLLHRKS